MMQVLSSMDLFSNIVGLRYSGNWRYSSPLGGILSLVTLIGTFSIIGFFGYIYITPSQSKRTSYEESKYFRPKALNLSDHFVFAVLTRFDDDVVFDKEAFNLRVGYIQVNKTAKQKIYKPLKFTPCDKSYFLRNIPTNTTSTIMDEYDLLNLDKALCVNTDNLTIQGSEVNDYYSSIEVAVDFCKTLQEENEECYSNSNMTSLFMNYTITSNIYYVDTAYNAASYPDVYSNYLNEIKVRLTPDDAKETKIYFSENTLQIEDGYIITNKREYSDKVVSQIDSFISVRSPSDKTSISYKLYSGTRVNVIRITFMTFSELLANVGGILTNLITISQIIMYYVNNISFEKTLIESHFRLEPDVDDILYKERRNKLVFKTSETFIQRTDEEVKVERASESYIQRIDDGIKVDEPVILIQVQKKRPENKLLTQNSQVNGLKESSLSTSILEMKNHNRKTAPMERESTVKFFNSEKKGYADILSESNFHKNEVKFNPKDFYKTYLCTRCFKSIKTKARKVALDYILDIVNYMYDYSKIYKTIREQEMLKYLLLDQEQLYLFNFSPPPKIYNFKTEDSQSIIPIKYSGFSEYYNRMFYQVGDPSVWKTKDENFEFFLNAIENVKSRKPKSAVDKKLLENFV